MLLTSSKELLRLKCQLQNNKFFFVVGTKIYISVNALYLTGTYNLHCCHPFAMQYLKTVVTTRKTLLFLNWNVIIWHNGMKSLTKSAHNATGTFQYNLTNRLYDIQYVYGYLHFATAWHSMPVHTKILAPCVFKVQK